MRTVYLNDQYLPEAEAQVSIFDRGFLFADSVYEVISVLDGKLVDFDAHVVRLHRSMAELKMDQALDREMLLNLCRELVARNALAEGVIYVQVTRGNPGDRDFLFPPAGTPPTIAAFTQSMALIDRSHAKTGLSIVTLPDRRWGMATVKTTQLLYASLMKAEAKAQGADDAWLVRDGFVTEGTSQNAHIVTREGVLVTHPLDSNILHGITQASVIELARQGVCRAEARAFSAEEAKQASEALVTAASAFVLPVTRIDGVQLGDGKAGPIMLKLREIYIEFARRSAI
ncbi:D-amino-acid transaminase [Sphingorhabdus sp.]|jgi:D-alanine transaminase|uniref:D-amino-acid transaminase n=1 Tax=Sphingorhabdus sp. TaxID=1902408 RepID=UPI003BB0FF00|nr:D-amino-acid transaminase [Sphingomonadales bacterium]MBL0021430.1 D-amino-acid transaminase [Sphingomonadales bacterium]